MTPLEQFNEEVKREFTLLMNETVVQDLKGYEYVSSSFIEDFITQKLATHKELILKMVREKAPNKKVVGENTHCLTCKGHIAAGECDCKGFNEGVQEFLNNLDTL